MKHAIALATILLLFLHDSRCKPSDEKLKAGEKNAMQSADRKSEKLIKNAKIAIFKL